MAEMKNLKIEVVRYNPEVDTAPHSAFYEVPYDATTSLLDALGYIKDNLAIADGKIRYQQFHFSSVSSQSATVKWHFDYSWRF